MALFGGGCYGLYAEWLAMAFDCASEGKIWAQGVFWPESEEARVLFCYLEIVSMLHLLERLFTYCVCHGYVWNAKED